MKRDTLQRTIWASRPASWINTAYPFAAAYFLATRHVSWTLVLGSLFFLIPYNLLMYGINDVFDYESDIANPRKGGVEGAKRLKEQLRVLLWASLAVNVPLVIAMLFLGGLSAKLVFILVIFMVLAYSLPKLRFKERPFVDSVTSSCHFAGPLVYALVLSGWQDKYWPFVLAMFLWGMASHAFGAVQDIIPDRKAGIGSIATVTGGAWTVRFSIVLYFLSFLLLVVVPKNPGAIIAGACNLFYIANVLPYVAITDKDSERANRGWKRFMKLNQLTGFIITLVLILTVR